MLLFLNFGVLALLTRYLSLKDLGIYMILMEIGRIACVFCQVGTVQSSQKFLGRIVYNSPEAIPLVNKRLTSILMASTILTVAVCAGIWNVAINEMFRGKGIAGLAFFGCIIIVVNAFQNYQSAVLIAINHMAQSVLSSGLIQKALLLTGLIICAFHNDKSGRLLTVLWLWGVAGSLSVMTGALFVHYRMSQYKVDNPISALSPRVPTFKELFLTSLPMGITTGMATLRNSADIIIIGAVLGPIAAGIYGPLRTIENLVLFVGKAIKKTLPATLAAARGSPKTMEILCRNAANYGTLAALPIVLVLIFAGGPVLGFVFGPQFSGYGKLMAILAVGVFVYSLFGAPGALLQMTGHEKKAMSINIAVVLISIVVMPFVATEFDLISVALASSIFLVMQGAALSWCALRSLGIRTFIMPIGTKGTWLS